MPEYEATRESFRRTVKNAEGCNVSYVTPWLWLGGGERRRVDGSHDADTGGDPAWDHDILSLSDYASVLLFIWRSVWGIV